MHTAPRLRGAADTRSEVSLQQSPSKSPRRVTAGSASHAHLTPTSWTDWGGTCTNRTPCEDAGAGGGRAAVGGGGGRVRYEYTIKLGGVLL